MKSRSIVAVWLSGVLGVGVVFFFLLDVPRLLQLRKHPVVTAGRIVASDRRNHMTATIEYFAEGKLFRQSFSGGYGPIGSARTIYYDAEDPSNAAISEPGQFVRGEIASAVAACLLAGTGLTLGVISLQRGLWARWSPARRLRWTVSGISAGVLVGFLVRVSHERIRGWAIAESSLVLGGAALTLVGAFRTPTGCQPGQISRSLTLIGGCALIIAGLALQALE